MLLEGSVKTARPSAAGYVLGNKMLDKKCLIIGSSGHQYVDCIEWEVAELPNIVDYDIVIVNVRSIKDSFLKNINSERIDTLRTLLTFCF